MGYVPMYAEEAFEILKPCLPIGTVMTSAYRSPAEQLAVIRKLAAKWNHHHPKHPIHVPKEMEVGKRDTWLPTLQSLRKHKFAVNAPVPTPKIPVSPHTTYNIVFDMAGAPLGEIEKGCRRAEKFGLMGFGQIKVEPLNNAVHVRVSWISSAALRQLYESRGGSVLT